MTHTLATLSNNAVASATIVFSIALLAHVAEWAGARQVVAIPEPVPIRALVPANQSDLGATKATAGDDGTALENLDRTDRFGRSLDE